MEAVAELAAAAGLRDHATELQNAARRDGAHVTIRGLGVTTSAALYWLLSNAGAQTLSELYAAGEALRHLGACERVTGIGQALIDGCERLNIAAMPAHDLLARGEAAA